MRVVGLGRREFATKWTFFADERAHTIEKMREMLLSDILPHERALRRLKKLPTSAAPPQLKSCTIKDLGTIAADALRLEAQSLFNVEQLLAKAEKARAERERRGVSDSVEVRQPPRAPAFDSALVGRRIEVCWPYKETGKTTKIWATGTVKRVADGLSDKRSARAKHFLPAGALLWAWEADADFDEAAGEQWLVLLPTKFNKHVHYGWRFDAAELTAEGELVSLGSAQRLRRAPVVDDCVTDDEHVPRRAR